MQAIYTHENAAKRLFSYNLVDILLGFHTVYEFVSAFCTNIDACLYILRLPQYTLDSRVAKPSSCYRCHVDKHTSIKHARSALFIIEGDKYSDFAKMQ